MTRTNLNMD